MVVRSGFPVEKQRKQNATSPTRKPDGAKILAAPSSPNQKAPPSSPGKRNAHKKGGLKGSKSRAGTPTPAAHWEGIGELQPPLERSAVAHGSGEAAGVAHAAGGSADYWDGEGESTAGKEARATPRIDETGSADAVGIHVIGHHGSADVERALHALGPLAVHVSLAPTEADFQCELLPRVKAQFKLGALEDATCPLCYHVSPDKTVAVVGDADDAEEYAVGMGAKGAEMNMLQDGVIRRVVVRRRFDD
uniref:Uncharacterized protein n=1 Tax=Haptolina ericina TaxID=156174 RepID=A0A7S3FKG0_9EUKA|mmetsp:Transcript_9196/g.20682  ORF Transcript_9196/g.20682 Transcript_9196/m.20682 type:complete len:248 (+) Transcript_9196:52-795(+)